MIEENFESLEETPNNHIDNDKPNMSSPEWSDYVLGHFEEDELWEGHPTASGLRRVTELLMGPITQNDITILVSPTENNNISVAKCTIQTPMFLYSDVADAHSGNVVKAEFSKFLFVPHILFRHPLEKFPWSFLTLDPPCSQKSLFYRLYVFHHIDKSFQTRANS